MTPLTADLRQIGGADGRESPRNVMPADAAGTELHRRTRGDFPVIRAPGARNHHAHRAATVPMSTQGPARAYYEACRGRWRSPIALTVTDADALQRSGMSLADRLSVRLL